VQESQAIYRQKHVTYRQLIDRLEPRDSVAFGGWAGHPDGFIRALNAQAEGLESLVFWSSFATSEARFLNRSGVVTTTGFYGPWERAARAGEGTVLYTPIQFTHAMESYRVGDPIDLFAVRVSPLQANGRFNASLSSSWEYRAIHWLKENRPETTIVFEVNPNLPAVRGLAQHGGNEYAIELPDLIVEDDSPPYLLPTPEPDDVARGIASNVVALVEDGSTLQLGFGTVPMMVGSFLRNHRHLGIHTEMFCDAHVDLIESGAVTNDRKGLYDGVSVATFAAGTEKLWRWVEDNPEFALLPVEEVNRTDVVARVRKLVSVNSALMVDLTGQTCAHCLGTKTYSGLGGAFEFTYGAQLSPGGKGIVCLPSTTRLRDGRVVSNVVASYPRGTRITIPEHCIDWVVTEYGAARLKFLPLEQRAKALIEIAHPDFREVLEREAHDKDLDSHILRNSTPLPETFFFRTGR